MNIESCIHRDFDDLMENIFAEYRRICFENKDLADKLKNFNKDEEIQKAHDEVDECRRLSLHNMSEAEAAANKEFRERHYRSCGNCGRFIYELTGAGIGEGIEIKCPICGEKKNITDFSCW